MYCFTFSSIVAGWGQDMSRAHFFVLDGLTERDVCVSYSSQGGEGGAEVVLVGSYEGGRGRRCGHVLVLGCPLIGRMSS